MYFRNVDIPFAFVLDDLQKRTAGDCSTINVTRLPYHLDECIRTLLKNPKNTATLLPILFSEVRSITVISQAIARLHQEIIPSNSQMLLGERTFEKAFDDQILTDVEILLTTVYQIKAVMKELQSYQNRLQGVRKELANLPMPLLAYVFDLVKADLKPEFSLLSIFFTSTEQMEFNNLTDDYGPGLPFYELIEENRIAEPLSASTNTPSKII